MAKKKGLLGKLKNIGKMDAELLTLITIMLLFGLIMVASASSVSALYRMGDSMYFFEKQLIVAVVGYILMLLLSRIDYHFISNPKILFTAYIVVWALMLYAAFFGEELNGARRWLNIGGFSLQPSEPAKIVIIILTAYLCSKQSEEALKRFTSGCLFYFAIIGVSVVPLLLERHKSASLLIAMLVVVIALVGGARLRNFLYISPLGIAGVLFLLFKDGYSTSRITAMFDPFADMHGSGWQAVQSLYAIGSGGLFGLGLGRSRQKIMYIPEPQNDFIFAIICEELGFIGALLVLILFVFFMIRAIKIAAEAPDKLGRLIAVGLTSLIMIQLIINIAVVTGLMPVTGMPLPFFSAGGTNLLFTLSGMGILLNVSRQSIKQPKEGPARNLPAAVPAKKVRKHR